MRALNRPKPTVYVERRADGMLVLSAGRVAAGRAAAGHRLSAARRRAPARRHLSSRAARARPRLAAAYLCRGLGKTGAVASWLIAQGFGPDPQADRHPVGQQPRERAVPVRRDARRRAGGADLAQLFAVGRFHPPRPCAVGRRARPGLRAGLRRATPRPSIARTGARSSRSTASGGCLRRAGRLLDRCRGRRAPPAHHGRHAGQDPVHLGLDRPAQGRAEHPRQSRRRRPR